ncbi:MAG: hypothetical protein ABSA65_14300 [Acidimicrobiales bacterium]
MLRVSYHIDGGAGHWRNGSPAYAMVVLSAEAEPGMLHRRTTALERRIDKFAKPERGFVNRLGLKRSAVASNL